MSAYPERKVTQDFCSATAFVVYQFPKTKQNVSGFV
jgi:hypothetical protein